MDEVEFLGVVPFVFCVVDFEVAVCGDAGLLVRFERDEMGWGRTIRAGLDLGHCL